ncbi:hypothetical protein KGF56_000461 [Candida oxycetoniae]|uniref:Uncharacterized protein n=1 Tax=Candida oxycetoniae TaxID=497107 RepID=A0AAI9T1M9_9ASCO|nr:uncharacterized protein KGF56_000461 [Candida oxycetoniae]KAI3406616.1 hypothetical protein KGF56_000461 [Candida oxycetoniae]
MKFTSIAAVATFVAASSAAAIYPDQFAPGAADLVISGAAYQNLLNQLHIDAVTASALGLTEGKTAAELASDLSNILERQTKRSAFTPVSTNDAKDGIDALVSGSIDTDTPYGFNKLLNILNIDEDTATQLDIVQGYPQSHLVERLAQIAYHDDLEKRGIASSLIELPVHLLTAAIDLLFRGVIVPGAAGFDTLLGILGINTTVAEDIGLKVDSTVEEWVAAIAKIIGSVADSAVSGITSGISGGLSGIFDNKVKVVAKRGIASTLIEIPVHILTDAIDLLFRGVIVPGAAGFDTLLGILGINTTVAEDIGLKVDSTVEEWVAAIAKIIGSVADSAVSGITSGISGGLSGIFDNKVKVVAKRGIASTLIEIPVHILTDAIDLLFRGVIVPGAAGFDTLLGILGINTTVAEDIGLKVDSTVEEWVAAIAKIIGSVADSAVSGIASGISGGLGGILDNKVKVVAKRGVASDLIELPVHFLTIAIDLLFRGVIVPGAAGFDTLLGILGINTTVAEDIGLKVDSTVEEWVAAIAKIIGSVADSAVSGIASGISGGLGGILDNKVKVVAKRGIASTAIELPIHFLTIAIDLLFKGAIVPGAAGFDTLLGILGINTTVAEDIGLKVDSTVDQWVSAIAKIIGSVADSAVGGITGGLGSILNNKVKIVA